ncbi:hypothetical protein [Sphingomonas sp. LT1P40]|uniref:hypothetical protein n=1 Tax=Alteristakelama amylovorans TaxID=3096166 RepID=UPI002FC5C88C
MKWIEKLIDNLPEIISRLSGNTNGLIAVIWLIGAVLLYFFLRDAPPRIRAIVFVIAFLGAIYLAKIVVDTNQVINKEEETSQSEEGWTYYQVTKSGQLAPPDGRLWVIRGGRQYGELKVDDQLKVADADGAKLYSAPGKVDENQIGLTDGKACLKVLETGQPRMVSKPPGSGGWIKVKVIACAGRK